MTEEPIKKEVVIIHDPKNPNQVEVCMDGQSTFVTMRPHSRKSVGAKSKDSNKKSRKSCKDKITNSPSDSEAYGTGSSVSEAIDNRLRPLADSGEIQVVSGNYRLTIKVVWPLILREITFMERGRVRCVPRSPCLELPSAPEPIKP